MTRLLSISEPYQIIRVIMSMTIPTVSSMWYLFCTRTHIVIIGILVIIVIVIVVFVEIFIQVKAFSVLKTLLPISKYFMFLSRLV